MTERGYDRADRKVLVEWALCFDEQGTAYVPAERRRILARYRANPTHTRPGEQAVPETSVQSFLAGGTTGVNWCYLSLPGPAPCNPPAGHPRLVYGMLPTQ